jgi:S1-C subfamily serine protease
LHQFRVINAAGRNFPWIIVNTIDLLIILFGLSSLARGYRVGLVRQAGSTLGFIVGLFAGSQVANLVISHIDGSLNKSLASLSIVLGISFILMTIGEMGGIRLKQHLLNRKVDQLDRGFGSIMSVITLLFAVWLAGSILVLGPPNGFEQEIKSSRVIAVLNRGLPPATKFLSTLNKLIDPNGFPEVFKGLEPHPGATATLPSLGSLDTVVKSAQASVVKVEGTGCGGIVEGSGFVFAEDEIATNAHVIAGVSSPKVIDANGIHNTRVRLFDPNLDVAVLEVNNLAGRPLQLNATDQPTGTPGVVLGYPGGGDFSAQPASVLDRFMALGRNIYGHNATSRDIYSLQAHVIPGNSGGPLVGTDGSVLGIVFATSTAYNNVGYALTGHQVSSDLTRAKTDTATYSTGSCSE